MNKNVVMCLWHSNSRKVACGLLIFVTATPLAICKVISGTDWMWCVGALTALVGGGTVADSLIGKRPGPDAPPAPPPAA